MIFLTFQEKSKKYQIEAEKGEDLLPALDIFLKKHRMDVLDIEDIRLDLSREKSITSRRIAETVLRAITLAKEWR